VDDCVATSDVTRNGDDGCSLAVCLTVAATVDEGVPVVNAFPAVALALVTLMIGGYTVVTRLFPDDEDDDATVVGPDDVEGTLDDTTPAITSEAISMRRRTA